MCLVFARSDKNTEQKKVSPTGRNTFSSICVSQEEVFRRRGRTQQPWRRRRRRRRRLRGRLALRQAEAAGAEAGAEGAAQGDMDHGRGPHLGGTKKYKYGIEKK